MQWPDVKSTGMMICDHSGSGDVLSKSCVARG